MDTEQTSSEKASNTLSKGEQRRRVKEKAIKQAKIKKALPWIIFITVVVGGLYWLTSVVQKDNMNRPGEKVEIMGLNHIGPSEEYSDYNSNPPTSGPHAGPAPWGFSETELRDENVIHNLEHGGIWITYKDLDQESIDALRAIALRNSLSVVVSPREANDSPVALASWGRVEKLDSVDVETINEYIRKNKNKSPEPIAR